MPMTESILERLRPERWGDLAQGLGHPTVRILQGFRFGSMPNAVLAHGPSGTGKTSAGRLFARALTCREASNPLVDPCGKCPACRSALSSREWGDNSVAEIDCTRGAPSEVIERINSALRYNPAFSTSSFSGHVILLDEVHRNEGRLADRLLKLIEDSVEAVFFLMTIEREKLSEPLRQRCLQVRFEPPDETALVDWLERSAARVGIRLSTGVSAAISRHTGRVPRQALTVLAAASGHAEDAVTLDDVEVALWHY